MQWILYIKKIYSIIDFLGFDWILFVFPTTTEPKHVQKTTRKKKSRKPDFCDSNKCQS